MRLPSRAPTQVRSLPPCGGGLGRGVAQQKVRVVSDAPGVSARRKESPCGTPLPAPPPQAGRERRELCCRPTLRSPPLMHFENWLLRRAKQEHDAIIARIGHPAAAIDPVPSGAPTKLSQSHEFRDRMILRVRTIGRGDLRRA